MRIRKRSCSAVLSWRESCEKKEGNLRITDGVEDKEEKFHLPLVAAAMDSQQTQDNIDQLDDTIPGSGTGMIRAGTEWRHDHKWSDILFRCRAGNSKSCGAIKVDSVREGEITKFNGKKIMRNKGDKIGFVKDGKTSDCRNYDSPKSGQGQFESDFMSWKPEHERFVESGDVYTIDIYQRRRTIKNRNSSDEKEHTNEGRSGHKKSPTMREEEEILMKEKSKALEKPMQAAFNNNNENSHVGSQCRRRNGRGWRCSQRTLVGYSLCEHHLGKGRLKSINTGNHPGKGRLKSINTGNGTKFL